MDDPFEPDDDLLQQRLVVGLGKIGLAMRTNAWRGAGDRGLTPTQGQILALLAARGDGVRPSTLAAALGVTAATASDAVAALVAKGLVAKERAQDDGRAFELNLTERGHEEARHAANWSDFLLTAVDELTPEEATVFLRGLLKMIRALQVRGQIPVSRMCATCRYFRPNAHPDPARPHHCAFVDAPFGDRHLRLDCPDQQPAPAEVADRLWAAFLERVAAPGG